MAPRRNHWRNLKNNISKPVWCNSRVKSLERSQEKFMEVSQEDPARNPVAIPRGILVEILGGSYHSENTREKSRKKFFGRNPWKSLVRNPLRNPERNLWKSKESTEIPRRDLGKISLRISCIPGRIYKGIP